MKLLGCVFEIIICMNFLFLIGVILTRKITFSHGQSYQLHLARLLFLSCILSPIAVQSVKFPQNDISNVFLTNTIKESLDGSVKNKIYENINEFPVFSASNQQLDFTYLYLIILIIYVTGIINPTYNIIKDILKTKSIIDVALPFKKHGNVTIKISEKCVVPFSIRFLRSSYIILPVSILHSPINTKLAIVHEGQHHRQGDCLWAYLIEFTRIIFWFNPSIKYWHQHFQELQELACDETLVRKGMVSAHDYGVCLLNVTQTASQYLDCHQFVCAAQMISGHKNEISLLIRRISMLSKYKNEHPSRIKLSSIMIVSAISMIGPLSAAYATKGLISQSATFDSIDTSSIDQKIQNIAAKEISIAVNKSHAKSGAIVIADALTGKIVAFSEAGKSSKSNSWSSRIFNPASTIKPFIAAAAFDTGIASASTIYDCRGPYQIDGKQFTNSDSTIGNLSIADAMSNSANTCMIKLAQDTGATKTRQILSRFGFDMKAAWNNNNSDALNLANVTIGSSIPVNLNTLINAYTILANKGHFVPVNSGSAVSEEAANSVTKLLEKSVAEGTGKRAAMANISVAGKTGTLSDETYTSTLALFAGYLPANSPRYVSIVVIENAKINGSLSNANGGNIAAPVFHNVFEKRLSMAK